ncbi:MAG: hypothetical protein V4451_00760, partial [Pseudomonadota bacterium]
VVRGVITRTILPVSSLIDCMGLFYDTMAAQGGEDFLSLLGRDGWHEAQTTTVLAFHDDRLILDFKVFVDVFTLNAQLPGTVAIGTGNTLETRRQLRHRGLLNH